jgi:hypothetical protein
MDEPFSAGRSRILTRTRAGGLPYLVDGAFWLIGVGLTGTLAGLIAQGRGWHRAVAASPTASSAIPPVGDDEQAFRDARERRPRPADMGEDFDLGDDQEVRRRLPRLFARCRGEVPPEQSSRRHWSCSAATNTRTQVGSPPQVG